MEAYPEEVIRYAERLRSLTSESSRDRATFAEIRSNIIDAAERLVIAALGNGENIYRAVSWGCHQAAIRCAIGLDLFAFVPEDGSPVTASEIAKAKEADRLVVVRIMRGLTSTRIFDEVDEETYVHNTYSRAFIIPQNRDLFKAVYDTGGRPTYTLPEYLEKNGWRDVEDYHDCAFQLGNRTELGMWEWLKERPSQQSDFNSGMQSSANASMQTEFPYPFVKALNATPLQSDQVLLVDIGGGRGQTLQRLKETFPELKGQLVLQELEPVIEDAKESGLPEYISTSVHDFFTPNPIKHARAYYFRRVFHDWSDPASLKILQNVVCSMGPESRVLISDNIVPEVGADWTAALLDLRMMALIAGKERTRKEWVALLEKAGLGDVKFWQADGSVLGIVEARLVEKVVHAG